MAQQTISVGINANDGTGDPIRTSFIKTNQNFTELYGTIAGSVPAGPTGAIQFNDSAVFGGDANITTDGSNLTVAQSLFVTGRAVIGDPGTEDSGVNINGTTYESSFKVSDIDGTNIAQSIFHRHSLTLGPLHVFARSNSNSNSHATVTTGQDLGSAYAAGWTGSNYKLFGDWRFEVDAGTVSDTSAPGRWILATTPNGSIAPVDAVTVQQDAQVNLIASLTAQSNTAIPANGTLGAGLMVSSTANFGIFFGSGAPTISAAKGSLYLRSDGSGTGDRMYVATDGAGTWTAVTTAA